MSLQKKLSKTCTAMSWTALCPVSKPSHSQLCNCLTCLGSKATLSHITVDNSKNVNSPLEGKLWRISKKNWTQSWGGGSKKSEWQKWNHCQILACFCLAQNSIYPSSHLPPGSHCSTSYFHSSSPSNFLLSSLLPNICLAQDSICLASYSRFNFSLFPIFTKAKENLTFWFWGKCLWVDAWTYRKILSSLIFNSLSSHYIFIPPFPIWISTCAGVLVVNVTWRGKTYVGTLLDCTRHTNQWSAPRFVIVNLTKATIAITSQMIP